MENGINSKLKYRKAHNSIKGFGEIGVRRLVRLGELACMPLSSMTSSLARPHSRSKKLAPLVLCCESETTACKGRLHRETICWPDMNCFPVRSTQSA